MAATKFSKPIDNEIATLNSNLTTLNSNSVWYGTCDTAASTQAKTASIDGFPTSLVAGLKVRLKFTNGQTYNGQPTLKINSLTAKNICKFGTTAAARYEWQAGQVLDFIYDGSNWIIVDGQLANGNYPGKVKLSNAYTSSGGAAADGVAASSKAVYDAYTALNDKLAHYDGSNSSWLTDCNSVSSPGFWKYKTDTLHSPDGGYGILFYMSAGVDYRSQIAIDATGNHFYYRTNVQGTWQSWVELK